MIRVLVVDDHAIVRRGLADLIRTAADLEVAGTAEDGARAIALAAELEPDVVLMDLSMPGVDGVAATAQILAARPEINVLVLTSLGDQQSINGALEAGARGYLLKHSEPEAILAAIREVCTGGSPLDPKAARVLLDGRRAHVDTRRESPLTAREEQVLRMVADGLANKMIARRLGITERTVKAHLTNVYQRIGVADRTQAALWVERNRRS